jgi:hypothetical protein
VTEPADPTATIADIAEQAINEILTLANTTPSRTRRRRAAQWAMEQRTELRAAVQAERTHL